MNTGKFIGAFCFVILRVFNCAQASLHSDIIRMRDKALRAVSLFDGEKTEIVDGKMKLTVDADDVLVFELFGN